MMAQNPPSHTRLRRLVARHFTPRAVEEFSEHISSVCARLLDAVSEPLRDGEVVDLHQALSEPLPLLLIAELLGVPSSDHGWLTTAVHDIAAGLTASATGTASLALADEQTVRMEEYFRDLAARRRADPGDDLISGLVRSSDRLTDDELVNLVWLLWLAGTDANMVMMDHCVFSILEFPGSTEWLRGSLEDATAFVDEVFRRTPPVIFSPLPRPAVREVEIGGVRYPAGTDIKPCFAAANRDPAVFAEPDRFNPARGNNREHLAFSGGIHHCLGAFLARTGLATASAGLHTMFPGLSGVDEPRWGGLSVDPASRQVRVVLEGSR
jgi:cytochrome P450